MSKAEKLSQNRYPTLAEKYAFIDGYEQAEKDLELTWEDIREICRMWIESKTPFGVTGEALSIEVLKRYKDYKERKEK